MQRIVNIVHRYETDFSWKEAVEATVKKSLSSGEIKKLGVLLPPILSTMFQILIGYTKSLVEYLGK